MAPLPQGLERHDAHGVREVQAAGLRADGDSQQPLAVLLEQRGRQPLRFVAKDQHVAVGEPPSRRSRSAVLVKNQGSCRGEPLGQRVPIVDGLPLQVLPIVEARAAQIVVVEPKAQRPHQPQLGPGGHARPAHAAGVVRNLRLIEHDVQQRLVFRCLGS